MDGLTVKPRSAMWSHSNGNTVWGIVNWANGSNRIIDVISIQPINLEPVEFVSNLKITGLSASSSLQLSSHSIDSKAPINIENVSSETKINCLQIVNSSRM